MIGELSFWRKIVIPFLERGASLLLLFLVTSVKLLFFLLLKIVLFLLLFLNFVKRLFLKFCLNFLKMFDIFDILLFILIRS